MQQRKGGNVRSKANTPHAHESCHRVRRVCSIRESTSGVAHNLTPAEGGVSRAPKWTEARQKPEVAGAAVAQPLPRSSWGGGPLAAPWDRAAARGHGPSPRALWPCGSRGTLPLPPAPWSPGPLRTLGRPHGFGSRLIAPQCQQLFGSVSLADGRGLGPRKKTWTPAVCNCYRDVLPALR